MERENNGLCGCIDDATHTRSEKHVSLIQRKQKKVTKQSVETTLAEERRWFGPCGKISDN